MKLLRVLLPVLVFGIMALAPHPALAANATFFGPIVPDVCHCDAASNGGQQSAPDFGCTLQVIENLMNFAISIGVIIFVLVAAYAGLMLMLSSTNPHNKETAKNVLTNAVVGLLLTLSAWLLVDFIMKTLYNPGAGNFGPWNEILGGGQQCLTVTTPAPGPLGQANGVTGNTGNTAVTPGQNCPASAPSVVAFPASATQGGTERATAATVQNFVNMRAVALQAGIDLRVTSGYRSDAEQLGIWNSSNCNATGCSGTVAKPCSLGGPGSNHSSGTAIDINDGCTRGVSSCNTPAYNWLVAHGGQYGFRNALPDDRIHWSPSGH